MSYTAKKWTSDETSKALELFKRGEDYSKISEKLDGRTAFAVQCKMEYYVYEKINSDTSYKTLAKELKKTESELQTMYESQKKRNIGKTTVTASQSNITPVSSMTFIPSPNNTYGIVNRVLTPYIEYHSNLEKLDKLNKSETISSKMFKNIKKILDNLNVDEDKFLEQLKSTVETKRIVPIKSDTVSEESDNSESDDVSHKSDSESEEEVETKKTNLSSKKASKKGSRKGSTKVNLPRKRIL
jgi:hypothetical protein